jgi:Holliday junction resolvase
MSEAKKQTNILLALQVIGCYAVKVIVANRAGTHDILACYKGRFYSIEVKDTNGVTSPLQLKKRKQVLAAGGKSIIAKTVKEVIQLLQED